MKTLLSISAVALLLATFTVSLAWAFPIVQESKKALPAKPGQAEAEAADDDFAPVDNMHHFMEYVCEPAFKGLKQVLATEPEGRAAWKAFKNHALVLAETSALVAARAPEDSAESEQWKKISLEVHKSGKALYKSAGKYEEAKKHFGLMVEQCNQCHTVFAEGKYQLEL